jgi:hypothetical protein
MQLSKFGIVISLKAASLYQRFFKSCSAVKSSSPDACNSVVSARSESKHFPWRSSLSSSLSVVTCSLVLSGLTGCDQTPATVGKELNKSSEMIEALNPKLPVGMALDAARAYMTAQGFSIEEKKKSSFKGKGPFDFLLCIRTDGEPPIKRRWEVAVIYDAKGVTELMCRTATVYP